jgi:molybdopterin/thiamine biosynthesis adenylyltransferase
LIADGDCVDITNLHRQILYRQSNCGDSKSDSAEAQLNALNDDVVIESIDDRLDKEALDYYVPEVDVVLDCTDNLTTRLMINRACYEHSVPLIVGAAVGWDGQLTVYNFADNAVGCYQCLFGSNIPQQQASCSQLGVMGPVVGIVGVAQALETIKLIVGMSSSTQGGLHLFDGRTFSWQKMKVAKHPQCPVCG